MFFMIYSNTQFPLKFNNRDRLHSLCVFLCKLLCFFNKISLVCKENMCNVFLHWVLAWWIFDQLLKHSDNVVCIQSRNPRVLYCFCADFTGFSLYIWMVNFCHKLHIWALERIVVAEINVDNELATSIWRICWS